MVFAGARLAPDQQRALQGDGGIDRHHQVLGGDVTVAAGKTGHRKFQKIGYSSAKRSGCLPVSGASGRAYG